MQRSGESLEENDAEGSALYQLGLAIAALIDATKRLECAIVSGDNGYVKEAADIRRKAESSLSSFQEKLMF